MRGPFGGRPQTECSIPSLAGGGALSHVRAGQRPAADTGDPCAGPAAGLSSRRRSPPAGHVARLRTGRDAPSVPRSHRCWHPGDRTHRPGPPARCQHRHPDLVDLDRRPRTSAGRHPRTRPRPDGTSQLTLCGLYLPPSTRHTVPVEHLVIGPAARAAAHSYLAAFTRAIAAPTAPTAPSCRAVSTGRPSLTNRVTVSGTSPAPGSLPGTSSCPQAQTPPAADGSVDVGADDDPLSGGRRCDPGGFSVGQRDADCVGGERAVGDTDCQRGEFGENAGGADRPLTATEDLQIRGSKGGGGDAGGGAGDGADLYPGQCFSPVGAVGDERGDGPFIGFAPEIVDDDVDVTGGMTEAREDVVGITFEADDDVGPEAGEHVQQLLVAARCDDTAGAKVLGPLDGQLARAAGGPRDQD